MKRLAAATAKKPGAATAKKPAAAKEQAAAEKLAADVETMVQVKYTHPVKQVRTYCQALVDEKWQHVITVTEKEHAEHRAMCMLWARACAKASTPSKPPSSGRQTSSKHGVSRCRTALQPGLHVISGLAGEASSSEREACADRAFVFNLSRKNMLGCVFEFALGGHCL